MKKTPATTKVMTSAASKGQSITTPTLPKRMNTVVAEVLSRLLGYQRLTGIEAVDKASTTRLAASIHYLQERYGWLISREDKVVGCSDGRVATISEYWISPDDVADAMAAGAGDWCAKVRTARLAYRTKAAQARSQADRANAAMLARRANVGQRGLFDVGRP